MDSSNNDDEKYTLIHINRESTDVYYVLRPSSFSFSFSASFGLSVSLSLNE